MSGEAGLPIRVATTPILSLRGGGTPQDAQVIRNNDDNRRAPDTYSYTYVIPYRLTSPFYPHFIILYL